MSFKFFHNLKPRTFESNLNNLEVNVENTDNEENTSCFDVFLKEIEFESFANSSIIRDRLNAYFAPEFKFKQKYV